MTAAVPFTVVIPARHASTRFPGKPLALLAGRPMLRHVCELAQASGAQAVLVATDDERIADAARNWGVAVMMTAATHESGTERLAEVAERAGWPEEHIVVNLQGDEPTLPPALIRQVAGELAAHPECAAATLCTALTHADELFDANIVKVVRDASGAALYFSRAPIPWDRDRFLEQKPASKHPLDTKMPYWRHLGLYAYRSRLLRSYRSLPPAPMERIERLEQLRLLWHGERINVAEAIVLPGPGVDTPADLLRAAAWLGNPGNEPG